MVVFRIMDMDIMRTYKLLHNKLATSFIAIEEVTVNATKDALYLHTLAHVQ